MKKEILFLLLFMLSHFSAKKAFAAEASAISFVEAKGKSAEFFSYEEISLITPFYGGQTGSLTQAEFIMEEAEHAIVPFPDPIAEPWHPLPTPPLPFSDEMHSAHLS